MRLSDHFSDKMPSKKDNIIDVSVLGSQAPFFESDI